MRYLKYLLSVVVFLATAITIKAQKIDTTIKIGKVGYKIVCTNKSADKNIITLNPLGFGDQVRQMSFEIKGRARKAEIDDLNNDGYPDIVIYIFNGDSLNRGNVVGISSEKNENVNPIAFPDILDDQKIREGYKGQDEFSLMEGSLMRRFPIYQTDSTTKAITPTGKWRQVQYRVIPDENGILRFRIIRSYDFTKS